MRRMKMKLAKYVMAASVLTMLAAGSCAQAADGSDFSVALIIGGGFDQTEALASVASEFPDQK